MTSAVDSLTKSLAWERKALGYAENDIALAQATIRAGEEAKARHLQSIRELEAALATLRGPAPLSE